MRRLETSSTHPAHGLTTERVTWEVVILDQTHVSRSVRNARHTREEKDASSILLVCLALYRGPEHHSVTEANLELSTRPKQILFGCLHYLTDPSVMRPADMPGDIDNEPTPRIARGQGKG